MTQRRPKRKKKSNLSSPPSFVGRYGCIKQEHGLASLGPGDLQHPDANKIPFMLHPNNTTLYHGGYHLFDSISQLSSYSCKQLVLMNVLLMKSLIGHNDPLTQIIGEERDLLQECESKKELCKVLL